jgi:hypothetical protein
LIFDEHVRCPLKLCTFAERQVIATVVFDDHLDAFGFIKRKASLRIGLLIGIVMRPPNIRGNLESEEVVASESCSPRVCPSLRPSVSL